MSNYDIPVSEKQNMVENRLIGFRTIIAQSEIDVVVFTAQGKTDEASAAQSEIDDAKAAIDALLALD